MKKLAVIILAICMLLTSCAPAADTVSSAVGPNEQAVPAAIQGAALSAATQNAGKPPAFSTLEYTYDELEQLPSAPSFDYAFSAPSAQWRNLAANKTPAVFSQVSYEFAEDMLEVDQNVTGSIASAGQLMSGSTVQKLLPSQIVAEGGYVSRDILDAAAAQKGRTIESGTVVVDKETGTAFKVVSPTTFYDGSDQSEYLQRLEGSYAVAAPQLHEIFKDFSLGGDNGETEEMVTVTRGNLTGFAPNIEANMVDDNGVKLMSFGDSYKGYEYIFTNYLVNLQFENERLDAKLGDGSPIKVTVSGGIAIENIEVYARYTAFKGYALAATLRQESYLIVEMDAEFEKEITIPVFGIDVGIGDVGRITGGVFVIVGMDGKLRVERVHEYAGHTGRFGFNRPFSITYLLFTSGRRFGGGLFVLLILLSSVFLGLLLTFYLQAFSWHKKRPNLLAWPVGKISPSFRYAVLYRNAAHSLTWTASMYELKL